MRGTGQVLGREGQVSRKTNGPVGGLEVPVENPTGDTQGTAGKGRGSGLGCVWGVVNLETIGGRRA